MARKLNPSVFLTLDPILDEGELLFGSGADGFVYQLEVGEHDDGDEINGEYPTGWLDMGIPEVEKMFVALHVDIEQFDDTLFVDWDVDHGKASGTEEFRAPRGEGGLWSDTIGTSGAWGPPKVWGGASDIRRKRMIIQLPQEAEGQRIQIKLHAEDKNKAWQVTNFSVMYKIKEALTPIGDV